MLSNLSIRTDNGALVTDDQRSVIISVIKLLYRLEVISEPQALDVITRFQSLFV